MKLELASTCVCARELYQRKTTCNVERSLWRVPVNIERLIKKPIHAFAHCCEYHQKVKIMSIVDTVLYPALKFAEILRFKLRIWWT